MAALNLFWGFVEYHSTANLEECLEYIRDRTLHTDKDGGVQVKEGSDKKVPYDGIVVIRNGSTLIRRLVGDESIDERDVWETQKIEDQSGLTSFLNERPDEDGAYVFESASNSFMRIGKVDYTHRQIEGRIPLDFVCYDGKSDNGDDPQTALRRHMGTKTRLAMELPQSYTDVHAFQIKRSGYGELRMGKVTHFDKDGLVEEFFMDTIKLTDEYCVFEQEVRPGLTVYGYYRRYRDENNKPNRDTQGNLVRMNPYEINPKSIPKVGIEQRVSSPA